MINPCWSDKPVAEMRQAVTPGGSLGAQNLICPDTSGSGTIGGSNSAMIYLGADSGTTSTLKLHPSSRQGVSGELVLGLEQKLGMRG